jgi:hypothetical protein
MVEVRRRGVPTAVICSTPFQRLGRNQAKVFGYAELPLVMIPHPLGGLTMDEVRARAEHALPEVIRLARERLDE